MPTPETAMKQPSHYARRLKGIGKQALTAVGSFAQGSIALFLPSQWARDTIHDFLNADETEERELLTSLLVSSTVSTMSNIGLISALVAGVISGAFSWYNIGRTHWSTRACWYSGLIFAFASISAAALCSGSLLRLTCHSNKATRVRAVMGYRSGTSSSNEWTPRVLQPWIWGTPGMLLKLSVLLFLVGLCLEIWLSAKRAGFGWESDDVKIAIFVTLSSVVATVGYAVAVVGLFFPTINHVDGSTPDV